MRRIVLGTNVLVSGLINSAGPSARLVDAVRAGAIDLVVCPHLLRELAATLAKSRMARYVTLGDAAECVAAVSTWAVHHPDPTEVDESSCRDPRDAYLVALSMLAGADALVSGDKDFAGMVGQVLVLTPRQAAIRFDLS